MRSIPVDVSSFSMWLVVSEPEPRIADVATGEVRKDRATGQTVYQVTLVAVRGRDTSVEQVSLVGEPRGLENGMRVRPLGLEATSWAMGDRQGISFRADSIVPEPEDGEEQKAAGQSGSAGGRAGSAGSAGAAGAAGAAGGKAAGGTGK